MQTSLSGQIQIKTAPNFFVTYHIGKYQNEIITRIDKVMWKGHPQIAGRNINRYKPYRGYWQ